MATANLDILVNAKNNASPTLKTVQADVKGIAGMGTMVKGALTGLVAAGAVTAITEIGSAMADLAIQAGNVQKVRASFDDLASGVGQSSDAMLSALREASRGTITDADLMLSANKAMMLGVADTAQEMTGLLDIARTRGQAMGLSTSQAFSDIVTGLGRESALILDNLGIVIDSEAALSAYAATLGKTADALTGVERKQALVNAVMAQSKGMDTGGAIDNAADAMQRLSVTVENTKVAMGELFGPGIIAAANALASAINDANKAEKDAREQLAGMGMSDAMNDQNNGIIAQMQQYQEAVKQFQDAAIAGNGDALNEWGGRANATWNSMVENVKRYNAEAAKIGGVPIDIEALQRGEVVFAAAATGMQNLAGATDAAGASAQGAGRSVDFIKAKLAELAGQSDVTGAAMRSMWIGAAGALGASQALAGFKASQTELQALRQEWTYMGLTAEQVSFREAEYTQDANDSIRDQVSVIDDANRAATNYAGSGLKAVNSAFDDLESKVSSVLSGSTDLSFMGDTSDIFPREDAVNENARRLGAIAREGLIGQGWLEEFKSEVPDIYAALVDSGDPQGEAKRLLREFQQGMVPELIDKDKAKDLVKRMIAGENNAAALASEIATELATELSMSKESVLASANAALGVKGTKGDLSVAGSLTDGTTKELAGSEFGKQVGDAALSSLGSASGIAAWESAGASAWANFKRGYDNAMAEWIPPAGGGATSTPTTTGGATAGGSNSISITINGVATDLHAVGGAARAGVLDALRARGQK